MQKLKQDVTIGSNIQRLRLRKGLTQEQTVAQLQVLGCSLTRVTYAKIELGTYNIRISELLSMAKVFQANIQEFFENIEI